MRPLTNISFSDRIRPSAAASVCQKMVGVTDGGEKKKSAHKNENTAVLFAIGDLQEAERSIF